MALPALPRSGEEARSRTFHRDAEQCGNDPDAGDECSAQRPGHFRFAAGAATMIHWHFQDPEARSRSAHLHLEVPAVSQFLHPELDQRGTSYGAEWAHVRIPDAVEQTKKPAGDATREDLLEIHAARLAFSARARADHKILFAPPDRVDQLGHELGTIAAVAVQENNEIALGRQRANSSGAGAAVTGCWFRDDFSARGEGALSRPIAAAIIHDDDFAGQTSR